MDFGAVAVAALVVAVAADGVVEHKLVDEGIVDAGVEALHQQVALKVAQVEADVGRGVERVRALLPQVGGIGYLVQLATRGTDMEVFVVDLRGAEAYGLNMNFEFRISNFKIDMGGIAQVQTRTDVR